MPRYLLTSLLIGGAVTVVIFILYFVEAFEPMVRSLAGTYATRGFFSGEALLRVRWLEILLIAGLSMGVSWCVIDVSRPAMKIIIAIFIALIAASLSPTLAFYNVLFDPFSSLAAVILSAIAGFAFAGTERGMRKRVLEDVLGHRVSDRTFCDLLNASTPPDFQGIDREVTVLTCRFLNLHELQGTLQGAELIKISNLFTRSVSSFLATKGAYLNETTPEFVEASFGLLQPQGNHAVAACRAALELRSRLRNLSQECESRWFQPLQFGIGITSGKMTAGIYGAFGQFSFGGIGAVSDFSGRLARANADYGSDLLMSPNTLRLTGEEFEVRPMDMLYDPEEGTLTEVYQLLAKRETFSDEDRQRRDLFWQGIIHLREKKYEAALDCFSRARVPGTEDGPIAYFIGKSQDGVSVPEPKQSRLTRELTEEGHARLISRM
jgi:class 3 adenylate cyclase